MRSSARGLSRAACLFGLLLALAAPASPRAADTLPLFDDRGYRQRDYRAPLPATAPGARTLDAEALRRLLDRASPVLVDVYAALRQPAAGFDGVWQVVAPRQTLPGAVWLPNVGYAALDPRLDRYFRDHLDRLTGGDRSRPLVVFCVVDCWMSWNAVKRAGEYGYRNLYWFRDGTDGWRAAGYPLR